MLNVFSDLLSGIEALAVALEVRPDEPGDVTSRVLRAIASSCFCPPGTPLDS